MSVTGAIRRMLASGLSIEQALIAAEAFEQEMTPPGAAVDEQAERRRAKDRARKRLVRGHSAESAESAEYPQNSGETDAESDLAREDITTRAPAVFPVGISNDIPPIKSPPKAPQKALIAKQMAAAFERFWSIWPNKVGKPAAARAFAKHWRDVDAILAGVERYMRDKPPDRQWLNPSTFLNQERWNDAPAPVAAGPPDRDRGDAAARELERIYQRESYERIGSQAQSHSGNVSRLAGPPDERSEDADDGDGLPFGHGELFRFGSGEGVH